MEGLVPGRIVYFVFDENHAQQVKARRDLHSTTNRSAASMGNGVKAGDIYPAMVVRVWDESGCSNLQIVLDGDDNHWAISVNFNPEKSQFSWHWMFDGQQKRYTPVVPSESS